MFFFFTFWLDWFHTGNLNLWPALEVWRLNHWSTREVPEARLLKLYLKKKIKKIKLYLVLYIQLYNHVAILYNFKTKF